MTDRKKVIESWLREQLNASGNFMRGPDPDTIKLLAHDLDQRLTPPPPRPITIITDDRVPLTWMIALA